jgi:formate dehydrogenase major subunit
VSSMIELSIDHQSTQAAPGTSVLDAASRAGIPIPTLCHHGEHPCQMCVVEIAGRKDLLRACSTPAEDGMVVSTQSDRIRAHRKHILEGLLSRHYGDCLSPCSLTCPAHINVQGYISLIAHGRYLEALRLIKEKNPLPLSVGRVCPHPCEAMCRRILVEERVPINHLKRFVADSVQHVQEIDVSEPCPTNGHRVAVIGGGPAGLSAAYYLARKGHGVTIFEGMPELGGMLRYAIPEYRLPKKILDQEIRDIVETGHGVQVRTGQRLGKDFTVEDLTKEGFEAFFIGTGAWQTKELGIDGENLDGVLHGLEFLKNVRTGKDVGLGKRVAVIGGGNSALDVARTCLRMGTEEVTIVYRRSRLEMPAREQEVRETEAEGVKLFLVATPSRIMKEDGHLKLEVLRTWLGEPDESGRRRPIPLPGSEFVIEVDNVIAAIGQGPDLSFVSSESKISGLAVSNNTLVVDPDTFETNTKGIFAAGDAVSGPRTVIEAIAAGRKAADSIHAYLDGEPIIPCKKEINVIKGDNLHDVSLKNFDGVQIEPGEQIPERPPDRRVRDFCEYTLGFSEDMALREARRCLGCGCVAVSKCELRRLAIAYDVDLSVLETPKAPPYEIDNRHPFITIDPNKCIFCQRCKTHCEYQAMEVGATEFDENALPLNLVIRTNERCTSCGTCVDSCPTGALVKKYVTLPVPRDQLRQVRTVCAYCGCGCNLTFNVKGESLVEVTSDPSHGPNFGNTCVKGRFGYSFVHHPSRLQVPLVRKGEYFVETSWHEALSLISRKFLEFKEKYGPQAMAGLSSAKCTNEENYVFQKFMRAVIGTNNVDHCARLCHASTVTGLAAAFGSGAMTNSMRDIEKAQVILLTGSNPTDNHPIVELHIRRAINQGGAKLIVADPRNIPLTQYAHVRIRPRPGTDVAWLNGLMHVIIKEGLWDKSYVPERTEDFASLQRTVAKYDPESVERMTGIAAEDLKKAARLYAEAEVATIIYAMGITQHAAGTDNVKSIANLAMLCGNVGIEGGGVNPLRGQNNVQGACDMGALPNVLPGYQSLSDPEIIEKFEKAWKVKIDPEPGLTVTEIWPAVLKGKVKVVYIVGENPVASDPNASEVTAALKGLDFVVVQDIFMTETAKLAHVVLPAASSAEKEGTFTNTERRIQRVRRAFPPLGQARPDWQIICELAERMGYPMDYGSPEEIMKEVARLTPIYGGIHYGRLEQQGIQWPCPTPNHPGTPYLHKGRFTRGKGLFHPAEFIPPLELPDETYPFIFSTGRVLCHYNSGTMTRKVRGLQLIYSEPLLEIHPEDAEEFGIEEGSMVKVSSRRGQLVTKVHLTRRCPQRVVFIPFHFRRAAANLLTVDDLDKVSKIPEYKVCAVKVEPELGVPEDLSR